MYSRVAVLPSGSRTVSRRTCSSAPSNTSSDDDLDLDQMRVVVAAFVRVIAHASQSLATRKSVYSRASGVPGSRLPVVAPFHHRRQRHQDRFGAAARLQAEQRAAVVHQVELDVAAAAVGLEVALALAVGRVLAPLAGSARRRRGNGRRRSASARSSGRNPRSLRSSKKMPPMPRGSLRCLRKKVLVAPVLEARVHVGAERRERVAAGAVEVARVLLEAVVRREVHAAAEPPHRLARRPSRARRRAHVHVHRGHVRDCADAAPATRPSPRSRGRRARAAPRSPTAAGSSPVHVREVDAAALEHACLPRCTQRHRRRRLRAASRRRGGTACRRAPRARATMRACRPVK